MTTIDAAQLRDRTDEVLSRVEQGEEVVVERDGRPVGKIVPVGIHVKPGSVVILGGMRGRAVLKEGWDEPMTPDVLEDWYGGPVLPESPE
jgi:prevent-host-death family protein